MLFLLNEQMIDLDIPAMTLRERVGDRAGKLENMSPRAVMALGQEMYFNLPSGKAPDEQARMVLACLIAMRIEADAALFVRPPNARRPQDVAIRFATLPITTLSFLNMMQEVNMLTPRLINENVWERATQESA